jgi:ribonuclease R
MLYRVHEPPEFSRIQKVREYVKLLGLPFPEQPTQKDYQAVIEATKERIDAPSIHAVLLRSMMQAYYGANNAGHFGLAYDAYTHFTSPIRRYPDLLLHRAIKAHLKQKPSPLSGAALDDAGEHFSQTERRADEASRSVTTWLKCHYMQQHLGEEFIGIISAVAEFGLFVTLKDLYVDGMIHVSQLGDDFFVYDQASQSLVGRGRGQSFSLGDEVKIKVAAVNLDDRKIDFELLQQMTHAGRAIRSRAPRVAAKPPRESKEEVFTPRAKAVVSEDGEQPIRKKKPKTKSPSVAKKSDKKPSAKSDVKAKDKDKVKKKSKPKKKKSNAKIKQD